MSAADALEARVRACLAEGGATPEEIDAALGQGRIDLLALDCVAVPGPRRYTTEDVAERS